jgi:hypothetical protein
MGLYIPTVPSSIGSWECTSATRTLVDEKNPYGPLTSTYDLNNLQIAVPAPNGTYNNVGVRIIAAANSANPLAIRGFSIPYYFTTPESNAGNYFIKIPANLFLYSDEIYSINKTATSSWSSGVKEISVNTTGLEIGMPVSGTGIVPGTIILEILTGAIRISDATINTGSAFKAYPSIDYSNYEKINGVNQYYKIQIKLINSGTISFNSAGKWQEGSTEITTGWLENTIQNEISPWSSEILFRPILLDFSSIGIQNPVSGSALWTSRSGVNLYVGNTINAEIFSFIGIFQDANERIESYKFTIHYNNGSPLNITTSTPLSYYEIETSGVQYFPNYTNISIEWINSTPLINLKDYYVTFEYTTVSGYNGSVRYLAKTSYSIKPLGLSFEGTSDPDNGRIEFLISGTQVRFQPRPNTTYGFINGLDKTASGSSGSSTITVTNSTGILSGMLVYGTGIATGAVVDSGYTSGNTIPLTIPNIGVVSGTVTFSNENNLATQLIVKTGSMTNKNILIWNPQYNSWGVHTIVTGLSPLDKLPKTTEDLESNYIIKLQSDSEFVYYIIPVSFVDSTETPSPVTKTYNDFYFVKKSTNFNSNSFTVNKFYSNINNFNRTLYSNTSSNQTISNNCIAYMRGTNGLSPYNAISDDINYYIFFGENEGRQFLYVKDLTNGNVDRSHS